MIIQLSCVRRLLTLKYSTELNLECIVVSFIACYIIIKYDKDFLQEIKLFTHSTNLTI